MRNRDRLSGFTLIELLVVVAVIAILIGILVPALSSARKEGWVVVSTQNLRNCALAVTAYTVDEDFYPPHYVYGKDDESGKWDEEDQRNTNPSPGNGYIHWSNALLQGDFTNEDAFKSPAVFNEGAPLTNPGVEFEDWETWQRNDLGNGPAAANPRDRQAPRMAFTGNAAIFPRNKFNVPWVRQNRLVRAASVREGSNMILATEFTDAGTEPWRGLSADSEVIKSHRPITPFIGASSGTNVYQEPDQGTFARFVYPRVEDLLDDDLHGETDNMIDNSTNSILNAVGRHHAGGTAVFVYIDGHAERQTVRETIENRKWGRRFYSLTGSNVNVDLEFNQPN